jgi:hypothetical protein
MNVDIDPDARGQLLSSLLERSSIIRRQEHYPGESLGRVHARTQLKKFLLMVFA